MIGKGFALEQGPVRLRGASLDEAVDARERTLRDAGVTRDHVVGLEGAIHRETVLTLLALRKIGAVTALFHPRLSVAEIQRQQRNVGLQALLTVSEDFAHGHPLASPVHAPLVRPARARRPAGDYVLFTSGTEATPKAVLLRARGLDAHADASNKRLPTAPTDRWLLSLSPAHVGGLALIVRAKRNGHPLVIPARTPLPQNLDATIRNHRLTHLSLVPTQLRRWLESRRGPRPPTLRAVLVGGAPCRPDLEVLAKQQGIPIRLTYGLTEAGSQVATQTRTSPPTSVGPPLPGMRVRIDDEPIGRISVKSPALFVGYLGPYPARGPHDGWWKTKDLGRLDTAGNLFLVGRADDVIITGGENVDPQEVEAALEQHPKIREACVVGLPDREWGQAVAALIVRRGRGHVEVSEVVEWCRPHLAPFKIPKRLREVHELPRTPTGKLQRARARELLSATTPT